MKASSNSKSKRINIINNGLIFVLPWVIGFMAFKLYPLLSSLYYSFTNYGMGRNLKFVGLQNYINIFTTDKTIGVSSLATVQYVFIGVLIKLAFALIIATVLSSKMKGINFFRTVYYIPSVMSGSLAICILWKLLLRDDGIINSIIIGMGGNPIPFLTNKGMAIYSLIALMAYGFGSSMVVFLAGFKQIPEELVEASKIDGCSRWKTYFRVKLPLITPQIFFNMIMQIVFAFQAITEPSIITDGGPVNSTYVLVMKLYDEAFVKMKLGYGCALSWVSFIAIGIVTFLIFKSEKYWVHYMN